MEGTPIRTEAFDYIVVGAGSAGSVIAARLSENANSQVLLLEAGGSDRRPWIRVPIGYGRTFHDPRVNWRYRAEPDERTLGRSIYWPRGKVLGGSSSINAMVYCRGLPADYDDWSEAGNPGWGWSDVEPIFRCFERRVGSDGRVEGDGPLWVSNREPEYHALKRHFYAAAGEIGYAKVDLNGLEPEGVGPYAINTRRRLRCSAADAFLRPAMRRSNLTVLTNVTAERVTFQGRRATGVVGRNRAGTMNLACRGEIIVCAGAVDSPKLLQLSGVGPGSLLRGLGIDVVHENDAVGGGLQDHLGINYFYRATEPTLNGVLGSWAGRFGAGLQFVLAGSGPFGLSVNQIGGLVRSSVARAKPDIQLYFNPLSYSTEVKNRRELLRPDPYPGFALGFNACRPTSRGRIDLASSDPSTPARIRPNYLASAQDVADALAGARLCGRLQETAAMRRLIHGKPALDVARATDEELVQDFRARSGSVYHGCGTCRMAPQAAGGVVGADLMVHGVEALRVADASIFPNITSANTNAPTILVAHKAAEAILAKARRA